MSDVREDLKLYQDPEYFVGHGITNGYDDYANCEGVLRRWAEMAIAAAAMGKTSQILSWLDVGAAYGFVVREAYDMGLEAVGVEPSEFALSQAHPGLDMRLGSLPDLPLAADERFDLITCTEVLEHVPEELTPASLQRFVAALAPDGRIVLLIMTEGPGADGDPGHINLHSRAWWDAQFEAVGLVSCDEATTYLNDHSYSESMHWSRRLWVLRSRMLGNPDQLVGVSFASIQPEFLSDLVRDSKTPEELRHDHFQ